jgi:hypothetical protein
MPPAVKLKHLAGASAIRGLSDRLSKPTVSAHPYACHHGNSRICSNAKQTDRPHPEKLTWGDFLRQLQDITHETSRQYSAEAQRIAAGLEQSNEAELARLQAAA